MAELAVNCSTCQHWRGNESAYSAPCVHPDSAFTSPAWDFSCNLYAAKKAETIHNGSAVMYYGSAPQTCPLCYTPGTYNMVMAGWWCGRCGWTWK